MTRAPITILYEDADLLVIDKPAGLVVHSDGRTKEETVVDWILEKYPELKGVGERKGELGIRPSLAHTIGLRNNELSKEGKTHSSEFGLPNSSLRPGIVHRLDRDTSGALLIAKHEIAHGKLKKQFLLQQVLKVYHAFVYGRVKNDEGMIDRPIARSRTHPTLWSATRGKRDKEREARTEYCVIERGVAHTLLELFPRTGRTHQIRVHLKAINYPVVCDKLYAPKRECALGFARLALHSRSISFASPTTGKLVSVTAPYPPDFERARALLEAQVRLES